MAAMGSKYAVRLLTVAAWVDHSCALTKISQLATFPPSTALSGKQMLAKAQSSVIFAVLVLHKGQYTRLGVHFQGRVVDAVREGV